MQLLLTPSFVHCAIKVLCFCCKLYYIKLTIIWLRYIPLYCLCTFYPLTLLTLLGCCTKLSPTWFQLSTTYVRLHSFKFFDLSPYLCIALACLSFVPPVNRTQDSKYATREKLSATYQKIITDTFLTSPLWYIWMDSCGCRINLRWAVWFILASFLHFVLLHNSAKEETKRPVFCGSSF